MLSKSFERQDFERYNFEVPCPAFDLEDFGHDIHVPFD